MSNLFRGMKENAGFPALDASARGLGVRPGIDVPAVALDDMVQPGTGGVSVSPDDPLNLPVYRRPPAFQGTGRDPVWTIAEADLGPDLCFRPDPTNPSHGFLEPSRPMTLQEYALAIARTQSLWRRAVP